MLVGDRPGFPGAITEFGAALAAHASVLFAGAPQDNGTGATYSFGIGDLICAGSFDPP